MKPTRLLPLLLASALLGHAAVAQPSPDFSGTWELNTDKGQNLGMVKAVDETVVITQTAARLTADITDTFMMKTTRRQLNYDLTGKSVPNEGAMGDKADTVAKWDGAKLVVTWNGEGAVAGTRTVKTETRELSADGRTMTVTTQRPNKEPMVMVFEKK